MKEDLSPSETRPAVSLLKTLIQDPRLANACVLLFLVMTMGGGAYAQEAVCSL